MSTKNVSEVRRENMEALFVRFKEWLWVRFQKEPERGMQSRFANLVNTTPAYISHVRNGRKEIGHGLARDIEAGMRSLGPEFADVVGGWLDNDHSRKPAMSAEVESLMESVVTCYNISPPETQRAINELRHRLEQVAK